MKIAATADNHLSQRTWSSLRSITGDSYYALGSMTKAVLDQKADILVMAGDIFDSTVVDPMTEKVLQGNLKLLRDNGVEVLSVMGNHDRSTSISRSSLFGTTQLTITPLDINGVSFCGIDYTPSTEDLQEKLSCVPPCDYLVLHAPFRHLLGFEGRYQLELQDVPAHVGCVIVGDIHVRDFTRSPEGVLVFSPGSTHPLSLAEVDHDHGVSIWNHGDQSPEDSDFFPTDVRGYYNADLSKEESLPLFEKTITDSMNEDAHELPPVFTIRVMKSLRGDALSVAERLGALIVSLIVKDDDEVVVEETKGETADTLDAALVKALDKKKYPKVFDLVQRLLNATDPEAELTKAGF